MTNTIVLTASGLSSDKDRRVILKFCRCQFEIGVIVQRHEDNVIMGAGVSELTVSDFSKRLVKLLGFTDHPDDKHNTKRRKVREDGLYIQPTQGTGSSSGDLVVETLHRDDFVNKCSKWATEEGRQAHPAYCKVLYACDVLTAEDCVVKKTEQRLLQSTFLDKWTAALEQHCPDTKITSMMQLQKCMEIVSQKEMMSGGGVLVDQGVAQKQMQLICYHMCYVSAPVKRDDLLMLGRNLMISQKQQKQLVESYEKIRKGIKDTEVYKKENEQRLYTNNGNTYLPVKLYSIRTSQQKQTKMKVDEEEEEEEEKKQQQYPDGLLEKSYTDMVDIWVRALVDMKLAVPRNMYDVVLFYWRAVKERRVTYVSTSAKLQKRMELFLQIFVVNTSGSTFQWPTVREVNKKKEEHFQSVLYQIKSVLTLEELDMVRLQYGMSDEAAATTDKDERMRRSSFKTELAMDRLRQMYRFKDPIDQMKEFIKKRGW